MNKKTFIKENASLLTSVAIAFIATSTLALFLIGLSYLLIHEFNESLLTWILFSIGFFFLAIGELLYAQKEKNKMIKTYYFIDAGIMAILSVLNGVFFCNYIILLVNAIAYLISLILLGILHMIKNHTLRNIIIFSLLDGICIFFLIVTLTSLDPLGALVSTIMYCIIIVLLSLITILCEAFSKIQFGTIRKILRKTYAWEILLGMAFLIVSFSFVFMISEGISYGDALWYCFAVVTTIGFGDIKVTSVVCRVLSVILGVYGIVVVALITSVIVNFYNETKISDKNSKNKDEEKENDKK